MAIFIFVSFEKLIMSSDDKNSTQYGLLDIDNLGTVSYNQTNLFNFYVLRKQVPTDKHLFLTDELETDIKMKSDKVSTK